MGHVAGAFPAERGPRQEVRPAGGATSSRRVSGGRSRGRPTSWSAVLTVLIGLTIGLWRTHRSEGRAQVAPSIT